MLPIAAWNHFSPISWRNRSKDFSAKKSCILLEVSRNDFMKKYIRGTKLSGRHSPGGRFDIVVLGKADQDGLDRDAIGVIELKREDPEWGGYKKDIKRLALIVRDCQTNKEFQFGCFAGIVCEKQEDKDKVLIEKLRSRWAKFMTMAAKQMGIKVRIFSSLDRPFKFDKFKGDNGKILSGYWRIDVIGCVFYR